MEDRYLFKAKRVDNGKWIMGLLTVMWGQLHIINPYDENTAYPVDKDTICQCTDLKDKNGKPIWENDIVNAISSNSSGEPICVDGILVNMTDYDLMLNLDYSNELECVGNKFDNAELLESEG